MTTCNIRKTITEMTFVLKNRKMKCPFLIAVKKLDYWFKTQFKGTQPQYNLAHPGYSK